MFNRSRFGQKRVTFWFLILGITAVGQTCCSKSRDWRVYGGDLAGTHYSSLQQINRSNVKQLQLAWTYDTKETGGLQTSPIVVNGVLYGISPSQKIFALDAATGSLKWKFDSGSQARNRTEASPTGKADATVVFSSG